LGTEDHPLQERDGRTGSTIDKPNEEEKERGGGARTKDDKLTCFYTNADSLPNKMIELRNRAKLCPDQPDIIAITEVKPKNCRYTLQPADYLIEGYSHFTCNLEKEATRGIIIWVINKFEAVEVNIGSDFEESIWLDVSLAGKDHLICGCIYRSPHSTPANSDLLNELIRKVGDMRYSHVMILGDFNYPGVDWVNHISCQQTELFLASCDDAFLHQHILEPTRGRSGQNSNLLDLAFSNEENMVTNIEYQSPLGKSDHACIVLDFICKKKSNGSKKKIYLYNRANYDAINEEFHRINWTEELATENGISDM